MVIGVVDIVYKKLKLKAHKLDKPKGKSQSLMLVIFNYGQLWFELEGDGCGFQRLIFWRLSHAQFFLACYLSNIIGLPCVQYEVSYMIWSPLEVYLNKINKFHFKSMRRIMT